MLATILSYAQDTTAIEIDTIPTNLDVYEYTVTVDTIFNPVDSTTTYEKRMIKTKIMSSAEWGNLVRYNERLIVRMTNRLEQLEIDLELAEDELLDAGEDKSLAVTIQTEIDQTAARLAQYVADLADLIANEDAIKDKYRVEATKKEKKKQDKEKEKG
jgi:hypothetical protein